MLYRLYQLLEDETIPFAKWKECLIGAYAKYSREDIPNFYEKKEYVKIEDYVKDELESLEKIFNAIQEEPFCKELMKLRRELNKINRVLR